jgi:hypothetical protein
LEGINEISNDQESAPAATNAAPDFGSDHCCLGGEDELDRMNLRILTDGFCNIAAEAQSYGAYAQYCFEVGRVIVAIVRAGDDFAVTVDAMHLSDPLPQDVINELERIGREYGACDISEHAS